MTSHLSFACLPYLLYYTFCLSGFEPHRMHQLVVCLIRLRRTHVSRFVSGEGRIYVRISMA